MSHNSQRPSQIKGGGLVSFPEESERAIVAWLLERQGKWPSREHDRAREHRRFVKQLVETHQRRRLYSQYNNDDTVENTTSVSITKKTKSTDVKPTGKVRIELVEALWNTKKGKKHKAGFQEGTRKILVVSRDTLISDLLTQANSKLRTKKKLIRAFVYQDSCLVDLHQDCATMENGTIVYVTSSPAVDTESTRQSTPIESKVEEDMEEDPLAAVKRAYQAQNRKLAQKRSKSIKNNNTNSSTTTPTFADHFNRLPPLTGTRADLPAAACRQEILQAVQDHRVVVLCGSTGCGKSTQVPQFLWEGLQACSQPNASIVVTQPRRVAATALAQRVSEEMKCPPPGRPGAIVGHHVRLDRAINDTTRIVYCTVGILLRKLVCPEYYEDQTSSAMPLADVSYVVVDEVHERDVNTDFCLTLLKGALAKNPHLRIILMSATASAQLFVQYFQRPGQDIPVVTIPGRTFPVEIKWRQDCERMAGRQLQYHPEETVERNDKSAKSPDAPILSPRAKERIDNDFIKALIASIIQEQEKEGELQSSQAIRTSGAILVFLPGKSDIEALFRTLASKEALPWPSDRVKIHKLYSGIAKHLQRDVFQPASSGHVKIILSTNLAETSITISDVSHVIDTGRVKESRFNNSTRIKELVTVWTSQASAHQRAGRGGRTCPGVCYKLYSEAFCSSQWPKQTPPEIQRSPLDELILQICLMYEQRRDRQPSLDGFPKGANPLKFLSLVPEPPPNAAVVEACQHLLEVDALRTIEDPPSNLYRLTPLGFHLSRLPMDPKVGKVLIVGCILQCLDGALTIAATLSSSKSCFSNNLRGGNDKNAFQAAVASRAALVENGFGGKDWEGGTVKGDLIAAIACFREWSRKDKFKEKFAFCLSHALEHAAMWEIHDLRRQYLDILIDTGFVRDKSMKEQNLFKDDARLTSCCLVAGMYPNVCTLMRPRKGGPRGGRLLTKDGDVCRPQSQSFQHERIKNASENGRDAYAVYHQKHRSLNTGQKAPNVFLSEVNFVSRCALLLFSGELVVVKNAIFVDEWLKFKVGDRSASGPVLLLTLREELDKVLLDQLSRVDDKDLASKSEDAKCELLSLVRKVLADE